MRLVLSNTKPRIPKIDFAVAKSTVALTDVKLSSYLNLNIFEEFFGIIIICTKSTAERGVASCMELLKEVVNQKRLRNTGLEVQVLEFHVTLNQNCIATEIK